MHFVFVKFKAYYQESILCLLLPLAVLWQSTQDIAVLGISYSLILFAALAYSTLQSRQIKWTLTPISLLLILWLLCICIPPVLGLVPISSLFGIFQCSLWVFIFFVCDWHPSESRLWQILFHTLWLLGIINAFFALFQFFMLHQMPCGFFMSKNTAAAFFMLVLFTITGQFLTQPIKIKQHYRDAFYIGLLGASIFILTVALLVAFSRGVIISFGCGLLVELWLIRKLIIKNRLIGFISLLLLTIAVLGLFAQPEIQHRLLLLQREKSRWIIWRGAWSLWLHSPWYGIGIFNFMHYYPAFSLPGDGSLLQYAHNDFLQLLIETGFPGILILLSLIMVVGYTVARYCLQKHKLSDEHHIRLVVCFTALLSLALHSVVDFNFYVLTMNLVLGCYLGYLHKTLKQEKLISSWDINFGVKSKWILNSLMGFFFLFMSVSAGRLFLMNHYSMRTQEAMRKGEYHVALKENQYALSWVKLAELYSQQADILLQLGQNAKSQERAEQFANQAQDAIGKALAINPYYAHPYFQMALVQLLLLHDQQQAQAFFYQALNKDPHDSLSRITFCRFLVAKQELTKAQDILEQGLNYPVSSEQAEIYLNYLAKLRYQNGEHQRAWQVAERLKNLSYYNDDYSDLI